MNEEKLLKAMYTIKEVCNEEYCTHCIFRINISDRGWICELSFKPHYWGEFR